MPVSPGEFHDRLHAATGAMLLATEMRKEYRDIFQEEFHNAILTHGARWANGVTIRWAIFVGLVGPCYMEAAEAASLEGGWG